MLCGCNMFSRSVARHPFLRTVVWGFYRKAYLPSLTIPEFGLMVALPDTRVGSMYGLRLCRPLLDWASSFGNTSKLGASITLDGRKSALLEVNLTEWPDSSDLVT